MRGTIAKLTRYYNRKDATWSEAINPPLGRYMTRQFRYWSDLALLPIQLRAGPKSLAKQMKRRYRQSRQPHLYG